MFLQVQEFAEHNDAILLVVVPAASVREVGSSKALKLAQELDSEGTPKINIFGFLFQFMLITISEILHALRGGFFVANSIITTFYRLLDLRIDSQITYSGKHLTRNNKI